MPRKRLPKKRLNLNEIPFTDADRDFYMGVVRKYTKEVPAWEDFKKTFTKWVRNHQLEFTVYANNKKTFPKKYQYLADEDLEYLLKCRDMDSNYDDLFFNQEKKHYEQLIHVCRYSKRRKK